MIPHDLEMAETKTDNGSYVEAKVKPAAHPSVQLFRSESDNKFEGGDSAAEGSAAELVEEPEEIAEPKMATTEGQAEEDPVTKFMNTIPPNWDKARAHG
jgi:hypothetical protein